MQRLGRLALTALLITAVVPSSVNAAVIQPSNNPLPWHWQNPLPFGNSVTALGCATATICFANGAPSGLIVSHDAGVHWSPSSLPFNTAAYAISCPSATVCFTSGGGGNVNRTTDGGVTWIALNTGATDSLVALSCPSTMVCYAIGSFGAIVATSDGGNTWVSRKDGAAYYFGGGISCPDVQTCFLVSGYGTKKTTDGGVTWTVVFSGPLTSISCPSVTTCYQAGAPVHKTSDGGVTWIAESVPDSNGNAISCADNVSCVELGFNTGSIITTVDGTTWAVRQSSTPLDTFACALNTSLCLGGGGYGALYRSQDHGLTWTEIDTAATRDGLGAVSCSGKTFCVAVGGTGGPPPVVVTTDSGKNWTLKPVSVGDVFTAVSCASTTKCVAVGLNGWIIVTSDSGTTWSVSPKPYASLDAVSCPTVSTCYAASSRGILKTTDGGQTWNVRAKTPDSARGINCPSELVCYVTKPEGSDSIVSKTSDGGKSWTASVINAVNIASISCTSVEHCVGVGTCHSIYSCNGYQAIVTNNEGRTWISTDTLPDSLNFVSCGSASGCIAVGSSGQGTIPGDIQVSSDGGMTWSDLGTINDGDLWGVSCNGMKCWAVGDGGAILAN